MDTCPVCGAENQTCTGSSNGFEGVVDGSALVAPQQRVIMRRRGREGIRIKKRIKRLPDKMRRSTPETKS